MSMRKFPLTTGLMLLLSSIVTTEAHALDLLDVYEQARQYDTDYMAALSAYQAARLDLPLAESARRPAITGGLGVDYRDDTFNPNDGESLSADFERGELNVDLNQNIYNRSVNYDIDAARYAVDIAELQLGIAEEDVIVQSVSRYLDVLAALDNQNLAELEQAAIKEQLDLATQRLEVGLGTRTDQFDAKARYEAANAEVIASSNEVINKQQALEALMGQSFTTRPKDELRPLEIEKVSPYLVEGDSWVNEMLPSNRSYQIAQRQVDLKNVEVARAADARFPTFGLAAGARAYDTGTGITSSGGDGNSWSVGVQASLPIYLGGSIKLKQEKAGYNANQAGYELEKTRRDTDRLIRAARRGVESLQRQVQALKEAVVAGKSALESKQEGFKAGVTTNLDVLDAQRDLFRAGRDYLKVSYDLVNAIVILERATGQLDGDDLKRVNSWLK